uniref:N-acetyltransferase domain-containing protein n=1 Tax=Tetradesmus obliquus TaxID=3088 RepID=A0A383V5Q1_TETOB|eukprot:jgi/Sobl393_1/9205/SZX60937.1
MSTAWGERLDKLHESRKLLYTLPVDQYHELPGRPNVVFSIKDYREDKVQGALECRSDMPFLFKAFETGQIGPRRLSRLVGDKPRNATIHEYLDWTVTGVEAKQEGEYDFSGFRLLVLLPRERVMWPAPGQYDKPEPKKHPLLGAPLDPLPGLQVKGKPLSAATIRTGPGYIEVPFVATHENKRGRGFGRCVVEAIEEVARAMGIKKLLLCSTREESVSNTWKHLGFQESNEEQLAAWDVEDGDLVHMQNTLQMHKEVPPPRAWRPLIIRHQAFVARVYMPADKQALSAGRSQAMRPGRHDMGAISGYKSSMATSVATNGSLSNASYGGDANGEEQQQQQQAGPVALANGGSSRQPPQQVEQQQEQQSQPMPEEQQQQQAEQQPVEDDVMLIDQPNQIDQPQYLLGGGSIATAAAGDAMLLPLGGQQQAAEQQQQQQQQQAGGAMLLG